MNRKNRLKYNTVSSLIYEIFVIICAFILPRFIIIQYGSEVNGLVSSISHFLSIITFLELGVGAVVQSSLYKPLADKNKDEISRIMKSAKNFFNKIATILVVYIIVLIFVYPLINNSFFDFWYIALLIIAIGINLLGQYYFGIVNQLLLSADQHSFIHYILQTIIVVINTIVCIILIENNASIQLVKFISAFIYLIRPIALKIYVDKHYDINYEISIKEEPIKQKWNGIAQHIASVILSQTDTVVLTLFSSLKNVSIYSVYFLVVNGIKTLVMSLTNGIQAIYGEYIAKKENEKLLVFFEWTEWLIHNGTVFFFGCTCLLIVPFVSIYTKGINDTNYIQPVFAITLTMAHGFHCLRLPYNMMILAAGHYKQTQKNYIIAAIINIVVSIATVKIWGLIGVAIGTLIAMLYQTIWMAYYNSKELLIRKYTSFLKQFFVDIVIIGLLFILKIVFQEMFVLNGLNYLNWILMSVKTVILVLILIIIVNFIVYRQKVYDLIKCIRKIV